LLIGCFILSGCAGEETSGTEASTQTTVLEMGDENCPNGGVRVDVLIDGVVQESETQYICNGSSDNQNDQGNQGDDVCANNIQPDIAIEMDAALVYQAGKAYSLKIFANKGGMSYRFEAPKMTVEVDAEEVELNGRFVTVYKVTPEFEATLGNIVVDDSCQQKTIEFRMTSVENKEIEGIRVPSGKFDSSVPETTNPVTVGSFIMSVSETTVEQFKRCIESGACKVDNYYTALVDQYCNYERGAAWLYHPMNCVNWHGANEYCEWIGGRLPTEDEWQYAATHNGVISLETIYPWGNDEPVHCEHANYFDAASYLYCDGNIAKSDISGTANIGSYALGKSPLGLKDMAGNVLEWTSSFYEADSVKPTIKGGAWSNGFSELAVSFRDYGNADYGFYNLGFRCIVDIE